MTNEEKRDELRERIEAAERRNEERSLADYARDATDTATEFVKDHPLVAVAGVAAIGLAIGAMTRPGRRYAREAGARTSAFATYISELGLAYASGLLDTAGDAALAGRDKLEDLGDAVGDSSRSLRRAAAHRAGDTSDAARRLKRDLGKKTSRSFRGLRRSVTH